LILILSVPLGKALKIVHPGNVPHNVKKTTIPLVQTPCEAKPQRKLLLAAAFSIPTSIPLGLDAELFLYSNIPVEIFTPPPRA
jgi:hypothetical protein